MDANYLKELIRRIEHEKSVHDSKFRGRTEHGDCLKRFEAVLEKLRKEHEGLQTKSVSPGEP